MVFTTYACTKDISACIYSFDAAIYRPYTSLLTRCSVNYIYKDIINNMGTHEFKLQSLFTRERKKNKTCILWPSKVEGR